VGLAEEHGVVESWSFGGQRAARAMSGCVNPFVCGSRIAGYEISTHSSKIADEGNTPCRDLSGRNESRMEVFFGRRPCCAASSRVDKDG
jgi:hypothetical protein